MPPKPAGVIAVFVKTPGYSSVKTRLARTLGTAAAEQFYELSIRAVEGVVRQAADLLTLTPCWAVAEGEAVADSRWRRFGAIAQPAGGLGDRLSGIYDQLAVEEAPVIFLGADAPQISIDQIRHAVEFLGTRAPAAGDGRRFVLGPATDGGFYLFAGTGPLPLTLWRDVPYSRATTCAELRRRLSVLGMVHDLAPLTDVDIADDLPRLRTELQSQRELLPEQQRVLHWLDQMESDSAAVDR